MLRHDLVQEDITLRDAEQATLRCVMGKHSGRGFAPVGASRAWCDG